MQPEMPDVPGVTHEFVRVGDLTFHVAVAGQGDPVVLLHGFPQHWYLWHRQIPVLSKHYRVICPDLRGFGWSDAPRQGYRKEQLATDMFAVLDALGVANFRLAGHDWGGWVGFLMCLGRPERVERYLALNIPHPFQRVDRRALELWRFWYQLVLAAPVLGPRSVRSGRMPGLMLRMGAVAPFDEVELRSYLDVLRAPGRAHASAAMYRTFLSQEFLPVIGGRERRRLSTPTRILFGVDDPAISPRLLAGHEDHCADLQVELVEAASHFIVSDRPDLVTRRLLQFFAGPDPAGEFS